MGWLQQAVERELPALAFDDVLTALMQVTEEIVRLRPPEYYEVPSRERFRRALLRLGVVEDDAPRLAEQLSLAHMGNLASMTVLPPGHRELLQDLSRTYRLGLISNFDHGPTAHRILVDHGLAEMFLVTVISDGYGRRKPHPAIFQAALTQLGVEPRDGLFIGDSVADDVVGAHNAGLAVVWVNPKAAALPAGAPVPDIAIAQLTELRTWLAA